MTVKAIIKVDDPENLVEMLDENGIEVEQISDCAVSVEIDVERGDMVTEHASGLLTIVQDAFRASFSGAELVGVTG